MINLIIIGADGQLGLSLQDVINNRTDDTYHLVPLTIEHINLRYSMSIEQLPDLLQSRMDFSLPTVIVNCAAYTAVDRAEEEPDNCIAINGYAVEQLAEIADHHSWGLISISSDYVFDGTTSTRYSESDAVNPLSVYGRSKVIAEQAMAAHADSRRMLMIRTQWLYAPHGNNFIRTMIKLANQVNPVRVISDQIGAPTSAPSLARAIVTILDAYISDSYSFRTPLLHYANRGACSWYDLAYESVLQISGDEYAQLISPINTDEYPTVAQRPMRSQLDCRLITEHYGIVPPYWRTELQQQLSEWEFYN